MPFADKLKEGVIDFLRMRGTEEVLPIFDNDKLRVWRINEEFDFLFGVGDGVDSVITTLDRKDVSGTSRLYVVAETNV